MMNWNDEATYIETIVHAETGKEFDFCDNTQLEYCLMQHRGAEKAGEHAAADRIAAAIRSEWPTANLRSIRG
jgi:hypothetical protein